jgi:hypothetical protein
MDVFDEIGELPSFSRYIDADLSNFGSLANMSQLLVGFQERDLRRPQNR